VFLPQSGVFGSLFASDKAMDTIPVSTTKALNGRYIKAGVSETPPRILIVDDEESILWSLSRTLSLSNESFVVGTASTAEDALDIIQTTDVNIIVTDLKLPNMSGLELVKHVKEISPKTCIILMTAYGNQVILQKANDLGCVAYLEKPFAIDLLIDYIDSALNPPKGLQLELSDLCLNDIIKLYSLNKQSTVLSINTNKDSGLLAIDKGNLTHAEFGKSSGPEALLKISNCKDAVVRTGKPPEKKRNTLALSWEDYDAALKLDSDNQKLRLFSGKDLLIAGEINPSKVKSKKIKKNLPQASAEVVVGDYRLQSIPPPAQLHKPIHLTTDSGKQRLRVEQSNKKEEIDDFSNDELVLQPEPSPPPPVVIPSVREEREGKLRQYVNAGIEHFKHHRLEEAKKSWLIALRIDSSCEQAKKNLEVLDKVLTNSSL
jgi:DNA-binding response OmpR family regulator